MPAIDYATAFAIAAFCLSVWACVFAVTADSRAARAERTAGIARNRAEFAHLAVERADLFSAAARQEWLASHGVSGEPPEWDIKADIAFLEEYGLTGVVGPKRRE